ncbi:MAG: hypothetical protein ACJ764_07510 [Solirubrobacteraceae bacterium]
MPRLTRARSIGLAAVAVTAGLAVFVSTSAGSGSSRASTHRAATFRAAHSRSTTGGYQYLSSNVVTLAAGQTKEGTINCKTKAPHPISGQFDTNRPAVFLASSHATPNGWYTRLTNTGKTNAKTVIGAVCAP